MADSGLFGTRLLNGFEGYGENNGEDGTENDYWFDETGV